MYTREIEPPPECIIENGRPVFGSFSGPFRSFDIRGVRRPFGDLPIPGFLTNWRIRGNVAFLFLTETHIGIVEIFDSIFFGFSEVTLWNRKTGQKLAYRQAAGPLRFRIPIDMESAVCACRTRKRKIKVSWNSAKKTAAAAFAVKGDDIRPDVTARFFLDFSQPGGGQLASVVPQTVSRRCMASWQVTAPLSGFLSVEDSGKNAVSGIGVFDIRRAYYTIRTKLNSVSGIGFIGGRQITVRLFSSLAPDADRYNENVLFIDGKPWPFPPVRITRPEGICAPWVIQDTENMVDLTFTPISDNQRKLSIFILRTEYHTVYGTLDGTVLTGEGEKIQLKSFPAIGKKLLLRF